MRKFLFLLLATVVGATAQTPKMQESKNVSTLPVQLKQGVIHNLVLGFGVITSVRIDSEKKIDRLLLGSKIISFKVEDELQRINFRPLVQQGATNMVLTVGGVDYSFVLQITPDLTQVVYTKTYTLDVDSKEAENMDLGRLGNAPSLKPAELDPVAIAKIIERARMDPVYRQALPDFKQVPINKIYRWNGCLIHLLEADAFMDGDLIAFKVQWVNTSGYGLYMNPRQLDVRVAGKRIPVKSSMQDSLDSSVNPGQMDTIWLLVQGERIAADNDWELTLPPDRVAAATALNR